MSRCLPFPPPGYEKKSNNGDLGYLAEVCLSFNGLIEVFYYMIPSTITSFMVLFEVSFVDLVETMDNLE